MTLREQASALLTCDVLIDASCEDSFTAHRDGVLNALQPLFDQMARERERTTALIATVKELRAKLTQAEVDMNTARQLAREATNGWACYAKRKIELDDISRLHQALDELARAALDRG